MVQPYGLAGAEQALLTGANYGLNQIGGIQGGVRSLYDRAQTALQGTGQQVGTAFSGAQNRLTGSGQAINQTISDALARLQAGGGDVSQLFSSAQGQLTGAGQQAAQTLGGARANLGGIQQDVSQRFDQGISGLGPYQGVGSDAVSLQGALSGASGVAAQQQALQDYQSSPFLAQARENAERAILRNAAATGNLGSGNTMDQLYQNAAGMFLQDYGNQFNRLGQLSQQGLSASATGAGLRGQQAGMISNLGQAQAQLSGQEAGIQSALGQAGAQLAGQEAGLQTSLDQMGAQLGGQQAGIQSALGQAGAQLDAQEGSLAAELGRYGASLMPQEAGLQAQLGQFGAQIPLNVGSQIAQYRQQAGRDIAGATQATTSSLAELVNQQGAGTSDLVGNYAQNINSLYQAAAQGDSQAQQQLAAILANLSTQSGSLVSGLPPTNFNTAPSMLGQIGQIASGIGGIAASLPQNLTSPYPTNYPGIPPIDYGV